MRARVIVRLKPGVLDPQGAAVEGALHTLGFSGATNVRVQKLIELDVDAKDADACKVQLEAMADKLLRNPVIEDFSVEVLKS
ncbi:MAG: phosphoribosylformylglycinamidine synthase subunit PurS [Deltaproteobacteria bacterium]|nr:phosphoribosylformylglycinamidine synthase subunit PurS [Deltaproteobacteria bacterium]